MSEASIAACGRVAGRTRAVSAFALRGLLATSRRSGLAKANCEASPRDSRIRTRNASCPPVQGGAELLKAQWVTRVTVLMHYRELASLSPRSEDYTEPCVLFFLVLFCCGIHSYCTVLTPPSSPPRSAYGVRSLAPRCDRSAPGDSPRPVHRSSRATGFSRCQLGSGHVALPVAALPSRGHAGRFRTKISLRLAHCAPVPTSSLFDLRCS